MSKNKKTCGCGAIFYTKYKICFNCRERAAEDHDLLLRYAGQAIPAVVERHALDGHVHDEATVARDAVALARALIAELRKGEG